MTVINSYKSCQKCTNYSLLIERVSISANQPPPPKKRNFKPGVTPKAHSKLNKPPHAAPPSQNASPPNYLLPPKDTVYRDSHCVDMPLVHATPTRMVPPGSTSIKSDNPHRNTSEGPQISRQVLV